MESIQNQHVRMWKDDGILYCKYKKDVIIDVPVLKEVIRLRSEFSEGKAWPVLIDGDDVKYWTIDSRNYAFEKGGFELVKASAFFSARNRYLKNILMKWLARKLYRNVTIEFFSDKQAAIDWLKNFVDKPQESNKLTLDR